jgi:hypothetical protein
VPKFKIETSLYEPITLELKDGRTLESVDFSDLLFRSIAELDRQKEAGTLDGVAHLVMSIALVFGVKREDLETIDIRVLGDILAYIGEVVVASRGGKPRAISLAPSATAIPTSPVDEVAAEKNGPAPGGEISQ